MDELATVAAALARRVLEVSLADSKWRAMTQALGYHLFSPILELSVAVRPRVRIRSLPSNGAEAADHGIAAP